MHTPAALEKRVGPFPIVGWLGLIAAGVAIGLVLRHRNKGKVTPAAAPMDLAGVNGAPGTVGGYPAPAGVPSGNAPAGQSVPAQGSTTAPVDNLGWSRNAIAWLIANGVDPNTADRAVRLYLEGQSLSIDEQNAIKLLLGSPIGVPPEYVPPQPREAPRAAVPSAPMPGRSAAGAKMLIRPNDGDIAQFISDGNTKQWVPDSYTALARVKSGDVAANGTDGAGWPIPFAIPRATVDALTPVGPAPNYGGAAPGPRTTW